MSDKEKVVFLAFDSDKVEVGDLELMACSFCRNKTFTLTYEGPQSFPRLDCAACKNKLGYMGWYVPENTPK